MSDNSSLRPFQYSALVALLGVIFFMAPVLAAEKPVSNLEKALKSGKKQILFAGKESDDVTIKKGISVIGTSPDKAVINGDIKMENGSSLANVTVSGKRTVIKVEKGASVTLSNVTVRGGADVGILAPEGGGTLTIKNSRIIKNRKGFYILPGKNLNLIGNVVSENREEGLDVRAGTSGSIIGNQFINNGEGGAEIIAGSSRLTLRNNTFAGNKSSGLAIQSYSGSGKAPGSITLDSNTFANNRQHGVTCGAPSGGGAAPAFYRATVKAIDNVFRGNGAGNIDVECGGVVNRSSVVLEKEETQSVPEEPLIDEAQLHEEALIYFDETVSLLHDREYALEQTLVAYNDSVHWADKLFMPVITGEAQDAVIHDIAYINALRDELIHFPEEWVTPELALRRQALVTESLRRMEELRQYFEYLQKPRFQFRVGNLFP